MQSAPSQSKIQNPWIDLRNDLVTSTRPKDLMRRTSHTETREIVPAENSNSGNVLREIQKHLETQHAEQLLNNQQLQEILCLLKNEIPKRENIEEFPLTEDERCKTHESIRDFRKYTTSLLEAATTTEFYSVLTKVDQMTVCRDEEKFFKLIVSRASQEEDCSMTYFYADLCQLVLKHREKTVSQLAKRGSPRIVDLLLENIEQEFESIMEALSVENSDPSASISPTVKEKHREKLFVLSGQLNRLLRFVGKLYNLSVLGFFFIMSMLMKLLDVPSESIVESICGFCETNVRKLSEDNHSAIVKWNAKPCQLTEFQRFVLKYTNSNLTLLKDKFPLNDKIRTPKFCYEHRW